MGTLRKFLAVLVCVMTVIASLHAAVQPVAASGGNPVVYPTALTADDIIIAGYSVMDYGAARNGTTDDTSAFQNALTTAGNAGGGVVFAPAGSYKIAGHLTIPTGVTLRGEWNNPGTGAAVQGTILMAYENRNNEPGTPFISMNQSSGLVGVNIWYPEQSAANIVPYPWTIVQTGGDNMTVKNVTLVNSYEGIKIGSAWNELHLIQNVYGTPLYRGIWIDNCTDVGRLENVNFGSSYWSLSGLTGAPVGSSLDSVKSFMTSWGIGIQKGRSDFQYCYNIRLRDYQIGIETLIGTSIRSDGQFYGLNIDDCAIGIKLDGVNIMGFSITNSTIKANKGSDPVAVLIHPNMDGNVQFNQCTIGGAPHTAVRMWNNKGVVSFQNCTFTDWGYQNGKYAVDVKGGQITLEGCSFQQNKPHIRLWGQVNTARILGNTFTGGAQIYNLCQSDIKIDHTAYSFEQASTAGFMPPAAVPRPSSASLYNAKAAPYNAKGDGNTDDTGAIQSALNAAASTGGTVYLPAGKYRLNGTLSIPANVELRGVFDVPHHTIGGGSVLWVYNGKDNAGGTPLITLNQNAGVRGISIYYPEQEYNNIHAYPYAIRGNGTGVYVINANIGNGYQGVDLGTNPCDNHYIEYVSGCLMKQAVFVGNSATKGWMKNTMFNPHYWSRVPSGYPGAPNESNGQLDLVRDYMQNNLVTLKLGYCGNEQLLNNFVFGGQYGLYFISQSGGAASASIIGHGVDCSANACYIEAAGTNGIEMINNMFTNMNSNGVISADKSCLKTAPGFSGTVRTFNSLYWGTTEKTVWIQGGTVKMQQNNIGYVSNVPYTITAGTVKLQNSYVRDADRVHVIAGTGITSLDVTGNLFFRGLNLENQAGTKVTGMDADWYTRPNLALEGTVSYSTSMESIVDTTLDLAWEWYSKYVNDGITTSTNFEGWCPVKGWTSAGDNINNEWIQILLPNNDTVGQVVLYPRDDSGNAGKYFPQAFHIQTSVDNANWTTVKTVDYGANVFIPTGPQVFNFKAVEAKYVRLLITRKTNHGSGGYHAQLCEFQIFSFDSNPGRNAAVTYSTSMDNIVDTSRDLAYEWYWKYVNDGANTYYVVDGWCPITGWTTAGDNVTEWLQYQFPNPERVKVDRVILYPRTDGANTGKYFPQAFQVQVSNDGYNWTTVKAVDYGGSVFNPGATPQTYTFTATSAKYIKLVITRKTNHGSGGYHAQLCEFVLGYK